MTVNNDQAIFDAIAAAVTPVHSFDATRMGLGIDVKKFIDTFNSHRDRKLCTSLDVAHPSWERLTSVIRPMIESVCSDGNSNAARLAKEVADALIAAGISGFAQAPPDQFMDDYKRDTTNAMAARILELEAALREIDNMAPATCEVTLAHQMADIASAALAPKPPVYDAMEAALKMSQPGVERMVAAVAQTASGCICQDQHRRGYCTEPGCPYALAPEQDK